MLQRKATIMVAVLTIAMGGAVAAQADEGTPIYIPMGSDNNIAVIDSHSNEVTGRINGVDNIHGLAIIPASGLLVAGSYSEYKDAASKTPAKPQGMSTDDHAAHHAPKKQTRAKDGSYGMVSIIDPGKAIVTRRIEVAGPVHHMSVSPDSRFAVATHPDSGGVGIIDLKQNKLVKTVLTGGLPNYATFSGDGKRLYVSNATDGTVSEVDTQRWIVLRNFIAGNGPEHLVMGKGGDKLYVNNVEDGTVSEIHTDSGKILRTFTVGGEIHGIDLSKTGDTLYVAGRERDVIAAVDLENGTIESVPLGQQPYHLFTLKSDGTVYVSTAEGDAIWVLDGEDLSRKQKIAIGGKGHQMASN